MAVALEVVFWGWGVGERKATAAQVKRMLDDNILIREDRSAHAFNSISFLMASAARFRFPKEHLSNDVVLSRFSLRLLSSSSSLEVFLGDSFMRLFNRERKKKLRC